MMMVSSRQFYLKKQFQIYVKCKQQKYLILIFVFVKLPVYITWSNYKGFQFTENFELTEDQTPYVTWYSVTLERWNSTRQI